MTILQNLNSDKKPQSTTQLNSTKTNEACVNILSMLERCILDGHDCNENFYKYKTLCKGNLDTK